MELREQFDKEHGVEMQTLTQEKVAAEKMAEDIAAEKAAEEVRRKVAETQRDETKVALEAEQTRARARSKGNWCSPRWG